MENNSSTNNYFEINLSSNSNEEPDQRNVSIKKGKNKYY
jgi:hypothetical protein